MSATTFTVTKPYSFGLDAELIHTAAGATKSLEAARPELLSHYIQPRETDPILVNFFTRLAAYTDPIPFYSYRRQSTSVAMRSKRKKAIRRG